MTRTLAGLFSFTVALGWCVATAQASTFVPEVSSLTLSPLGSMSVIGPIPAQPGTEGMVILSDNGSGGHQIAISSSVWSTINHVASTSLYTGIPYLSTVRVTVKNQAGTFASGFTHVNYVGDNSVVGPYLGGEMPLSGNMILTFWKGAITVTFDLAPVGGPAGGTQVRSWIGITSLFELTHSPWVTGAVPVTGITTNVVSINGVTGAAITMRLTPDQQPKILTTSGGYVTTTTGSGFPMEYHTVTLLGSNALGSASQSGTITLVSPIRIDAELAFWGRLPGAAWMDLTFVPEPGTMLLLVAGAIGLAVIGRRRLRGSPPSS